MLSICQTIESQKNDSNRLRIRKSIPYGDIESKVDQAAASESPLKSFSNRIGVNSANNINSVNGLHSAEIVSRHGLDCKASQDNSSPPRFQIRTVINNNVNTYIPGSSHKSDRSVKSMSVEKRESFRRVITS